MLKKVFLLLSFIFLHQWLLADVPNEIRYNGKLKEYRTEISGTRNINFKIYNSLTGGTAKWESGTQNVVVSSGVFSVVISPDIDWRDKDYYIELEVNGKRLEPREKLTAMPYALHSNSTESAAVKDGDEFSVKVGNNKRFAVNSYGAKTIIENTEYFMVPRGAIIIWSGTVNNIPTGWLLCDGNNGTPDLRARFVLGAVTETGTKYSAGNTGGEEEHILTIDEMPKHSHNYTNPLIGDGGLGGGNHYFGEIYMRPSINSDETTEEGSSQAHNNMPPYYALCYIMKE